MMHLDDYTHYESVASRMGYTVLWGVYSMTLIIFGILKKRKDLRVIAIALFGVTIMKLVSDAMRCLNRLPFNCVYHHWSYFIISFFHVSEI